MRHSADSSVWRSLAVAFGDGLAFGVGMKLTQHTCRQADAGEASSPSAGRIQEIEQRLARLEHLPALASSAPFDREILESVAEQYLRE